MAYYDNAPKKKARTNYGDMGAWEEEGSRYGGDGRKPARGGRTRGDRAPYASGGSSSAGRNDRKPEGRTGGRREGTGFSGGRPENRGRDFGPDGGSVRRENRGERRPIRREDFSPAGNGRKRPEFSQGELREPKTQRNAEEFREQPAPRDYRDYEYRPASQPERQPAADEADDRILCGRNPIREALRSGREIEKLLVQKGELSGSAREIVQEARARKIMVQEADKRRLDEIAPHHQGLIAFAAAYPYATVEEILDTAAERKEAPFIVILDGVTDPHNLGAVIRTAECVGAHGVVIPLHRSVGLTPAAVKASAGAIEHIKIARVTNLNRTIEDLKRNGIWTYAVTMDGKDYEKVDFHDGTALVIGAEGEGISRLTAEKCDLAVSLPLRGTLDSLNASVAAGVMMYRVLSCRRKG